MKKLKEKIEQMVQEYIKSGQTQELSAVRSVLTKMMVASKQKNTKYTGSDDDIITIIRKEIKELDEELIGWNHLGKDIKIQECIDRQTFLGTLLPEQPKDEDVLVFMNSVEAEQELTIPIVGREMGTMMKALQAEYGNDINKKEMVDKYNKLAEAFMSSN